VVSGARLEQLDGVARRVGKQGGVDRDAGSDPPAEGCARSSTTTTERTVNAKALTAAGGDARRRPVALGHGLPLFKDLTAPLRLKLVDAQTYDTGAALHIYHPAPAAPSHDPERAARPSRRAGRAAAARSSAPIPEQVWTGTELQSSYSLI
jgi:hypothetical protein